MPPVSINQPQIWACPKFTNHGGAAARHRTDHDRWRSDKTLQLEIGVLEHAALIFHNETQSSVGAIFITCTRKLLVVAQFAAARDRTARHCSRSHSWWVLEVGQVVTARDRGSWGMPH